MSIKPLRTVEQQPFVVFVPTYEWKEYLKEVGPDVAQKVSWPAEEDGCVGIFEGFRVHLQDRVQSFV